MAPQLFDKTKIGNAQEALDFLSSVLESSTEYSIIGTDLDGTIVLWNEGARRRYGYEAVEVVGKLSWDILYNPEDVQAGRPREVMEKALREGKWEGLLTRVRKHGQRFSARVVVTPRRDRGGLAIGFLLISKDLATEIASQQAEEKFRALLESAPDAMIMAHEDGHIVLVNSQTERLFGYRWQELLGQPVEILVPPRFREGHPADRRSYMAEPRVRPMGQGRELFGLHKDGSEFPVEISLSPLRTERESYVISAVRDVTERKRFAQALHDKNVELEKASQAKDRFLATMSHELRTPLNAIIGFTGTLLMKLPGPLTADQDKQLRTVQTSAKHLLSLINDLLDLAKIESGKVELNLEPVVCQGVIHEVVAALRPLADSRGLRLEAQLPAEDVVLRTDRRAVHQILINLATNAIKFTEQGAVRVELSRRQEQDRTLTTVSVIDTGIGIRPADQAKLFQAFSRIEAGSRRRAEGTGLGLHLSRRLAELIGASIAFQSEPGKGSTFTLVFPEQ